MFCLNKWRSNQVLTTPEKSNSLETKKHPVEAGSWKGNIKESPQGALKLMPLTKR